MEAKDMWCPQHGYPLPCYKCGMPLSQPQRKEIYELGKKAGIREVVEWLLQNKRGGQRSGFLHIHSEKWQAKLKEWGIKDENTSNETGG